MAEDIAVQGIIKTDNERYKAMKAVYDACVKGSVTIPAEVMEYFELDTPLHDILNNDGVLVEIPMERFKVDDCIGWDIKVKDIPEKVDVIRVFLY